jgi:cyanate permease
MNSFHDFKKEKKIKNDERGSWAIGGCTMIGIGVGFIFLKVNVFYFIAAIMCGIGLGLLIASLMSNKNDK